MEVTLHNDNSAAQGEEKMKVVKENPNYNKENWEKLRHELINKKLTKEK